MSEAEMNWGEDVLPNVRPYFQLKAFITLFSDCKECGIKLGANLSLGMNFYFSIFEKCSDNVQFVTILHLQI